MPITLRVSARDAGETRGLLYQWQLARPGQAFQEVPSLAAQPADMVFVPTDDGVYSARVFVTDSQD